MTHQTIPAVIDAAYASVLEEGGWHGLLESLARLFNASFADIFARSEDRTRFHGVAHGMDRSEYDDVFLGVWVKRNIWGTRKPVRAAGEIVTTREMVPRDELMRHEMYNDFLGPRGLHEGLRLAIWAGDGWIQDVSLLRPWSAGPYGGEEIAAAQAVLPHLQRAAAIGRRLGQASAVGQAGAAALDALRHGVYLVGVDGRVLWSNRAGEAIAAMDDGLCLDRAGLRASQSEQARKLAGVIGHAVAGTNGVRRSGSLRIARPSGRIPLTLIALPIRRGSDWTWLNAPAALVVVSDPESDSAPQAAQLSGFFGLTVAESELAVELLAGRTISEIAGQRGRSINTVRSQLARLMAKTDTNRQTDLMRVLLSLPAPEPPAGI